MNRPLAGDELQKIGIERATIIGGGVIGASWAALFLANGLAVVVNDPDPDIAAKVKGVIDAAKPALSGLGYDTAELTKRLSFDPNLPTAVVQADVIQENGPERPDIKQDLWRRIEEEAPRKALLFSSSSGLPASAQNIAMKEPGRLMIGHPFNPPHLMPLVELVPSALTDAATINLARRFYRAVGKVPLEIKKEVPGFVANRLQAALLRESVYLVREGVVSMRDVDDVVTSSIGIRWAINGPFLSFHLGGGPGGLAHFIEHIGKGGIEALWASFAQVAFDDATTKLLTDQAKLYYGGQSMDALAEDRDQKEVAAINAIASIGAERIS